MKIATIRDLRHDTTTVLSWVADGESVEVRRRGVPVAMLSPRPHGKHIVKPDFETRLRAIYGDQILAATGSDVIAESRGES